MGRRRTTKDCCIRGCERAVYKGELCKGHWDSVPFTERIGLSVAVMQAQRRETERQYARLRRLAQEIAASEAGAAA